MCLRPVVCFPLLVAVFGVLFSGGGAGENKQQGYSGFRDNRQKKEEGEKVRV